MNTEERAQLLKELTALPPAARTQLVALIDRADAEAIKLRTENGALWGACNKITANTSGFASAQAVITRLRDELAKVVTS